MKRSIVFATLATVFLALLIGCAANPVTGRQELNLVSQSHEIKIGHEQYVPSRQMQGGDYTIDPALSAYVDSVGQRLAQVSDRKLPYEFVVLNNSVPNAWALPGGKIAVNRGLLLELENEAELAAVLGHEIVHSAARHGAKSMERGMLMQGAVLAAGLAVRNSDYASLVTGGAMLGATLITHRYGRDAEREADYYGMLYLARAGYDPKAAIGLQETFVRLSENRRQDWLSGLFASHPPSRERVAANRVRATQLPAGGELGRERYQQKIAHLKATRKAYKAYDEGSQALQKGDLETAHSLAAKAIAIEPREALFHALLGDVNFSRSRYRNALADYDQALERNRQFFRFYLQRGLTRRMLGDAAGARQDLEHSTRLLPTAMAYNALGDLARASGEADRAISYYQTAAGSKSAVGQQAARSLVDLDLPRNPGRYLSVQPALDANDYLLARITNSAPVAVRNVHLLIRYRDGRGYQRDIARTIQGTIGSNRRVEVALQLGPLTDSTVFKQLQIIVAGATPAN